MICEHKDCKEIYRFDLDSLNKCNTCGLIFSSKYWENFDVKTLYEKYYDSEIAARFKFKVEYIIRLFRLFRAFKIFTLYPKAGSILDIGSGRGFMLYYLKKYFKYKKAVGNQIAINAVKFSRTKLGLEIYDKDLLELPLADNIFDIITMWQVLEHLSEPEKYIERVYSLLNKGGKLVIEVPNFNSWTRALTGKYWLGLDLDYHITFFTPESLSIPLTKYNYSIERIHTFSLEYSTFISVQSLVSLITKSNHLIFQFFQTPYFKPRLIYHFLLFILLTPVCFLINILLYFSKRGEVLLIVAKKD